MRTARRSRSLAAAALVAAAAAAALVGAARDPAVELDVWVTHGMEKVRPDEPPRAFRAVELLAARNEFEPFQLVLRAPRRVRGIDVTVTDLEAASGGHRLDGRHAAVYLQLYLELSTPSSAAGGTGEWPDPLVPRTDAYAGERRNAFPFDLAPERNQPLWLEIYVPPGTPPGRYRGAVRVAVEGRIHASVPVSLEVLPFTLPSTASLPTSFGFSGPLALRQHRGRYTSDADLYALVRSYAVAALRHRVSLHGGNMVPPPVRFTESAAVIDWSRYDRELRGLLDGTLFRRGEPLAGARLTTTDVVTVPGLTAEQTVLYWRAWGRHFRSRGWLDRLFLYLPDEPTPADYPEVLHIGSLARLADPELSTLVTEQLVPDLAAVIDVWTPLVNCIDPSCGESPCEETVPRAAYGAVEEEGASLWWYLSCASHGCGIVGDQATAVWPSYVVDAPPAAARIMPWLAWVHDVAGELYYNTVEAWGGTADPWTDVHVHGGNGDGTLFYPGAPERIGGSTHVPVESLRLKLIREGLEDYEYLTLLAGAGGERLARARAEAVAAGVCRWERRPEALYAAREAIARELARRSAAGGTAGGAPRSGGGSSGDRAAAGGEAR